MKNPEAVALARELRQTKLSYEKIAVELESRGYKNRFGKRFSFDSVRYMIGGTRYRKHPTGCGSCLSLCIDQRGSGLCRKRTCEGQGHRQG